MQEELIKKIKLRGYWRINFQPLVPEKKLETLSSCKEIVERSAVELRGWDYPHFPRRSGEDMDLEPCENYYQGWTNWNAHKEFWRMYQSGQFLHYLALREDWVEEDQWISSDSYLRKIKPMKLLGVTGSTVYQLTEIFEFLRRLVNEGLYDEGVAVKISLNNIMDRELWIEDIVRRAPFFTPHKTGAAKFDFSEAYSKEQIMSQSKEIAMSVIKMIFERFGWDNPSSEALEQDQNNLLAGKP